MVRGVDQHHMARVMGLVRDGQTGAFIAEIEFTLRYVPNHTEALIYAETIGKITNSVSYPIQHYENAIRIFPGQPLTYMQYGAYLTKIGYSEEEAKTMKVFRGKGCPTCNNTGYKGRVALNEVMLIKDELKELILEGASSAEIKKRQYALV